MPASSLTPAATWPARALCLAVLALAGPAAAWAQEGCEFGPEGNDLYRQEQIPGGGIISYVSNPHFLCADGVQIWADSAVAYSELGMSHLMGSVRYVDRTRELRADTARYFSEQARLQATGHLFIRDEADGSQVRNGDLVYLRQTDFRPEESMTVVMGIDGVYPEADMTPAAPDSAGPDAEPPVPYSLMARRIYLRGASNMAAAEEVRIERESLIGYSDSLEYREDAGDLLLEGSARVVTAANRLTARIITMGSPGSAANEIRATHDAVLEGDDLTLTSPEIFVFLNDGALERLVAIPIAATGDVEPDSADSVRPIATVEDFVLTADSIEVIAPGDVVERVFAAGRARSVSAARDSLNVEALPEIARSDWLEGDTVVVHFVPVVGDSAALIDDPEARGYAVESVTATGRARSLYRLVPTDSTARAGVDPPAVHYVVGDQITITMVGGEVDAMNVVGQTRGVHLEPLAPAAVADSVADSTVAVPDTSGVTPARPVAPAAAIGRGPVGSLTPNAPDGRRAPAHPARRRRYEPWRPK